MPMKRPRLRAPRTGGKHPLPAAAAVLALLLLAAGGCGKTASEMRPGPAGAGKAAGASAVPVRTATAQKESVARKVEFVGSLAGVEQVTLSSEVDGTIGTISADLGDTVRKGQLLLQVREEEFRFRKEQARAEAAQIAAKLGLPPGAADANVDETSLVRKAVAEFNNAKTDLDRRKSLLAKNLISRKEVDDADARFLVAEANVRSAREEANNLLATLSGRRAQLDFAEKKLRDTQVRSPIDGAVEARLVSAGEYLKVGTPMFKLVNDRPIRMIGEVPEAYAGALAPGQVAELVVDGRPGKVYRGTLRRISPASNVANRAVQVEAVFPNANRELKSGFFGKGAILLRVDPNVVSVPKAAVVTFAGIEKVFVVDGTAARERKVRLGEDLGDRIEIAQGVAAGDRVVLSNTGKLAEGTVVSPVSDSVR